MTLSAEEQIIERIIGPGPYLSQKDFVLRALALNMPGVWETYIHEWFDEAPAEAEQYLRSSLEKIKKHCPIFPKDEEAFKAIYTRLADLYIECLYRRGKFKVIVNFAINNWGTIGQIDTPRSIIDKFTHAVLQLQHYELGKNFYKQYPFSRLRYSDNYINEGYFLLLQGKYKEAIKTYSLALPGYRSHPEPVETAVALTSIAYCHAELGQMDKAMEASQKAIEECPTYADAHSSMGALLCRQGKYEEALPFCEKGVELAEDDVVAQLDLAVCYLGLNNMPEATKRYDWVISQLDSAEKKLPYIRQKLAQFPQWSETQQPEPV